jgi:Protein of unknown function (DUF4236)
MGLRYRKSITIVPGVRLNVSHRGVGYSVGGKGLRVSKGADGRVRRTVSIPGTGLSHTTTLGSGRSGGSTRPRSASTPAPIPPRPAKPGLLAPRGERDLHAALFERTGRQELHRELPRIGRDAPALRVLAATLHGFLALQDGQETRARELLGWVFSTGEDPAAHPFASTYLTSFSVTVRIAAGVGAELPLGREAVGLAVAELHQDAGDIGVALWTVEQLPTTTPVALSLADLLAEARRHEDVVDLTDGVDNQDDATALLCVLRGAAMRELGYLDASREALKEALRVRSRSTQVRHLALLERARTHIAQNKMAMARKDLERILAEDSRYPGLSEALAALPS